MPPRAEEHAYSISLWEWSVLLASAARITLGLLLKAGKGGLGGHKNGLTLHQYITYEGMRDYQCGLNAIGIQNLLPSTLKTCEKFARRYKIERSYIHLPDGTIAPWLGSRKASRTVVFFHGGGYMSPILGEQISLAFGFAVPSQSDVSVVILPYNLACENANYYPRQLQQAASLINHLLHSEKLLPSTITLIGDSAGAHLVLSLLLHLRHPHHLVPHVEIEGPLSGAVLISPWVTMDTSAESMYSNKGKDILSSVALAYWARNFLGGTALDCWNSPLIAPDDWWDNLLVEDVLITYGDCELLRDDIAALCTKLESRHANVTALKFPGEIHVHMVMNRFLRINAPCESEKALVSWMKGHLRPTGTKGD